MTPEQATDMILKAAGSDFKHYTMPSSQNGIIDAVKSVMVASYNQGLADGYIDGYSAGLEEKEGA